MAIKLSGLVSGMDTDAMVQELVSAYSTKKENIEKKQTKLQWTMDAWKDMNSKIYGFYSKSLNNMWMKSNYTNKKATTVSDSTKATVTADSNVANGTQTLEITKLAKAGYLTGSKISASTSISATTKMSELGVSSSTLTMSVGTKEKAISISANMTVREFTEALSKEGVNANFDATQQRFFVSAATSGTLSDFNFVVKGANDEATLTSLGLTQASGAIKQNAENSIITVNGATFESQSNTITVNGMTITARGETTSQLTVTTETDVDGIYNMIKDFIKEYNTLVNSMDSAYNAENAKGYEPLTDDEKEEMSEEEIEKWEKKIKDSLLRRDSTLSNVSSAMKTMMTTAYEIDGKNYSLSSFGISTLGYFVSVDNEKNAFHIDGDSDDTNVSSNANKLRAAIANDPDKIADFFTKLTKGLYDDLTKRMSSTTLSSVYTVYNDKKMQEDYNDYDDEIDDWEDKVADMEDYYYDKFTQMETAMSKLQSQTSSLSQLLGTA